MLSSSKAFPSRASVCKMESALNASLKRSSKDVAQSTASSQPRRTSENPAEHLVHSFLDTEHREQEEVSSTENKLGPAVQQLGGPESKQQQLQQPPPPPQDCCSRERLKRHRDEVAGRVMIPDSWGQENFLTDWIEPSTFDALLAQKKISSAREALMAEARRAASQRLRIESRCWISIFALLFACRKAIRTEQCLVVRCFLYQYNKKRHWYWNSKLSHGCSIERNCVLVYGRQQHLRVVPSFTSHPYDPFDLDLF